MAFSGQSVEGPVYYNNCGAFGKFQHQNDTKFECSCPTWVSPSEWPLRKCIR